MAGGIDGVVSTRVGTGRLSFLDGIRGLSAFYVLMFHSFGIVVPQSGEPLTPPLQVLQKVFGYGHMAVCVFIVLSGFSLMLPLVRQGTFLFKDGITGFFRRRGRRVLPPYYAALALSIAVVVGYQSIAKDVDYKAAMSPGSIVSHLLLVHNASFDWAYRINGPMWSVATEWQIYFLMPFLLIPLWRRLGGPAVVILAWLASIAVYFALPADRNFYWAAPWFVGSFAFGMLGAEFCFADQPFARRVRGWRWGWASLGCFVALLAILMTGHADWPYVWVDGVVSLFAIMLVMACANQQQAGGSIMTRFFSARPIAALGGFSYSMYLLQHPLLKLSGKVFGSLPLSYSGVLTAQLLIGTPIILACSWLFAEFVERPFTGGGVIVPALRRRLRRPATVATATP